MPRTRKQRPAELTSEQRAAEAWKLRSEKNLEYDKIAERLGYASSLLAEATVRWYVAGLDDDDRAELAMNLWLQHHHGGRWALGILSGYRGPSGGHRAFLEMLRVTGTLISGPDIRTLPTRYWRTRAEQQNAAILAAQAQASGAASTP